MPTTDLCDIETGLQVISYDSTGSCENLGYFDDWKEAWDFVKKKHVEYRNKTLTDPNFCKSVTLHTMELFDAWNYCMEKFGP